MLIVVEREYRDGRQQTDTASLPLWPQNEIGALESHVRAVARYHGGIVLVEGPAGSGKTSLIGAAALRARREGVRFLTACPGSRGAPLAPLVEASLGRALPARGDLCERLAKAADHGPLVVVVDDLHAADDATLLAVRGLPRQLAALPILWLLTLAPGRADPTAQVLVRGGAEVISLEPLSRHAVSELARHILGGVPSDAVLDFVGDLADRPALIVELLEALVSERLVEAADGRARLTGLGLHRAMGELRRRRDRHAPGLEVSLGLTR